jgi:hypothetical protein
MVADPLWVEALETGPQLVLVDKCVRNFYPAVRALAVVAGCGRGSTSFKLKVLVMVVHGLCKRDDEDLLSRSTRTYFIRECEQRVRTDVSAWNHLIAGVYDRPRRSKPWLVRKGWTKNSSGHLESEDKRPHRHTLAVIWAMGRNLVCGAEQAAWWR